VAAFNWRFERYYEVTYELTLEVIADLTQDVWQSITASLDDVFNADFSLLTAAVATTVTLPISLSSISTAQAQIGLLQDATPSVIAPLTTAVSASNAQLQSLLSALDDSLPAGSAGGVVAGGDPADLASGLLTQTMSYQQLAAAVQGVGITSRMIDNLEASV
jgi:hypothetical protein